MTAQAYPLKSNIKPLIPTVKVCVLCNPGKQIDNYVCPACEKDLAAAIDAKAIQAEAWDNLDRCQTCTGKVRFPDGIECKWEFNPGNRPAVEDATDVLALALHVPEVMEDFLLDTADHERLALILVELCGQKAIRDKLKPLIANWVNARTEAQVQNYVSKHYGA